MNLRTFTPILIVMVFACYAQVIHHQYLIFDDFKYVVQNEHVNTGVTIDNIQWAFTSTHAANWHPLTWVSYMIDFELFGENAGRQLLVNVILHAAAVLMLLGAMIRLTGDRWRSLLVAAIFALHPLHVESVAWVSERKDVLSALFGFAALWAYASYVQSEQRPWFGNKRYWLCFLLFACGLMSKPMLVTLPMVMLLLDFWPLARIHKAGSAIIIEKLPMFALSAICCAITWMAQTKGDAIVSTQTLSGTNHIAQVVTAYGRYLGKMFWPTNLIAYYPMPALQPIGQTLGLALLLIVITAWAVHQRKSRPHLLVGWLWFLGTLVPVVGVVKVGMMSIADRYMHIPMIGLAIAAAWSIPNPTTCRAKRLVTVAIAAAVLTLSALTYQQVKVWRDSITLFEHALTVAPDHARTHHNLARAYRHAQRFSDAQQHLRHALKLAPDWAQLHVNLADLLRKEQDNSEAIELLKKAIEIDPTSKDAADAHHQLGSIYVRVGQLGQARYHFEQVMRLAPHNEANQRNLERVKAAIKKNQ